MPAPQKETQSKGEKEVKTKYFREFKGIYTKAQRVACPENNFYDLVNLIPVGHANLHTVPDISSALADYTADPIYWTQYVNINSTDYMISFSNTGKVFAYNIGTSSSAQINGSSPLSGAGSRIDQWKNSTILIADSTGYYSWDGTTFTGPMTGGTALPTISSATGSGSVGTILFATAPSSVVNGSIITLSGFTPSGWNGKFAVTFPTLPSISSATVAGNIGTITFGSAHGLVSNSLITLSGFNPLGWNGTYTATVTGGTTVTINFIAPPANATTNGTAVVTNLVTISTAAATASIIGTGLSPGLLPQNTSGPYAQYLTSPDVAVFSGRAWIYSNRALYVSALNDYTDFTLADGSLVQNLTDPQLRGQLTRMISANGYLYLLGKSSSFVISDVYIPNGASPPAPVFSILNVQAIIGCDQPGSVFPFNRDLCFANSYGLWKLSGVTAEKMSDDIDGTMQYVNTDSGSGGLQISGGTPQVYNLLQASFLIKQVNDPAMGTRTIVANYFDEKWWFADYGSLTFVATGIKSNQPALFGIKGNKLYQLYQNSATAPYSKWETALWPMEDSLADKEVFRAGFEMVVSSINSITANIDTPNSTSQFFPPSWNQSANVGFVQWINNSGSTVTWQNNSLNNVFWFSGSYLLYVGDGLGGFAKYIGITGSATAGSVYQLSSNMFDYSLRKRW